MELTNNGKFHLKLLLRKLYLNNVRNLLVEGGSRLSRSFLKSKLFERILLIQK